MSDLDDRVAELEERVSALEALVSDLMRQDRSQRGYLEARSRDFAARAENALRRVPKKEGTL